MKKLGALSLVLLLAASALFADDGLAVTGRVTAGVTITNWDPPDTTANPITITPKNDGNPLRGAVNFAWTKGEQVVKWNLRTDIGTDDPSDALFIDEFYGASAFLDSQFRLTVGKIPAEVWKSGGRVDANIDAGHKVRLEYKPSFLPGFNVGLLLPLEAVSEVKYYFGELGFGAQYFHDFFEVSFGVRLDSEGDTDVKASGWALNSTAIAAGIDSGKISNVTYTYSATAPATVYTYDDKGTTSTFNTITVLTPVTSLEQYFGQVPKTGSNAYYTWTAPTYEAGTTIVWGLRPILTAIVPGLTFKVDGSLTGLGGHFASATGVTVGFALGGLDSSIGATLSTYDEDLSPAKKTGVSVSAAVSYKVFPWLKPGIEPSVAFYTYHDGVNDYYKTTLATGKDLAGLDNFGLVVYAEMALGNGLTFTPRYALTMKTANGPSLIEDILVADWTKARTDHKFELRFGYSF
jgi:hypothetical protein